MSCTGAAAPRKDPATGSYVQRKDAAQGWVNETLAALQSGSFTEPTKVTFGRYLETWLAGLPVQGRRATTIESYERHVRLHVLSKPIAHVRLQGLSPLQLDALYAELLQSGRADGEGALSPAPCNSSTASSQRR